jgi:hypothetical protein
VEIYSSDRSTVSLAPLLHGSAAFSEKIRELCLSRAFDCIAVDLPEPFEPFLAEALDDLPVVSAIVAEEGPRMPLFFLPIDPCDAAIEAVRQAHQNHIHFSCIGHPHIAAPVPLPPLPDTYAVKSLGYEAYSSLCLHAIGANDPGSQSDREAQYIAFSLHKLRQRFANILAVVHLRHFARTLHHFKREETHNLSFPPAPAYTLRRELVDPDHLYFVLGELPFVAAKYEKARYEPFSAPVDIVACIKDLFRETRDDYRESQQEAFSLSPARIQRGLQFLRNLTLLDDRFVPGLFDIVAAAKGIGGNSYALHILKCARYYPYLPADLDAPLLSAGIDRIILPSDPQARDAVNLLRDFQVVWKNLSLKPEPTERQKRKYRFFWDPRGMCSHMPEDKRIENFNAGLREKAKMMGREDLIHAEKFTVSIRDGIDVRETLSNWHTGDIYVKNLPPSQGALDTMVIIFDAHHDDKYPHLATWYAEHDEESTLTFYSTDPFDNMIGPGIARSHYGGLSLLFPPRPVPNIFDVELSYGPMSLAERLTFGALLFSGERRVGFVCNQRPWPALNKIAAHLKKRLVWIPLSHYSAETLSKLRMFHVLNGKEVRSWAGRFIGE